VIHREVREMVHREIREVGEMVHREIREIREIVRSQKLQSYGRWDVRRIGDK
jgi:hypothetical protein